MGMSEPLSDPDFHVSLSSRINDKLVLSTFLRRPSLVDRRFPDRLGVAFGGDDLVLDEPGLVVVRHLHPDRVARLEIKRIGFRVGDGFIDVGLAARCPVRTLVTDTAGEADAHQRAGNTQNLSSTRNPEFHNDLLRDKSGGNIKLSLTWLLTIR